LTKPATASVRSTKPRPEVWIDTIDVAMALTGIVEMTPRRISLGRVKLLFSVPAVAKATAILH
jgi:hypothetical protein